ncbi:response regulator [Anatilimnocola floriformis]|uniref:response regulator n=1 Tax=Anatilimnocola floriformis TaxID=2948575 RepID=UPI0020C48C87|nr:response regulator [Anatilimnocola floriformis]
MSVEGNDVLVIDDNSDSAHVLALLLRSWGYRARIAYSALEGLDAAKSSKPKCIVSDIGMPGMTGYDLARLIRQDDQLRDVPLIAFTAYSEPHEALKAGFDSHLVKTTDPLLIKDLLAKIVTMDKRLDQSEDLIKKQGEVIAEARDVMREVHKDVKEIKEELKEVKEDVGQIKKEIKEKS